MRQAGLGASALARVRGAGAVSLLVPAMRARAYVWAACAGPGLWPASLHTLASEPCLSTGAVCYVLRALCCCISGTVPDRAGAIILLAEGAKVCRSRCCPKLCLCNLSGTVVLPRVCTQKGSLGAACVCSKYCSPKRQQSAVPAGAAQCNVCLLQHPVGGVLRGGLWESQAAVRQGSQNAPPAEEVRDSETLPQQEAVSRAHGAGAVGLEGLWGICHFPGAPLLPGAKTSRGCW